MRAIFPALCLALLCLVPSEAFCEVSMPAAPAEASVVTQIARPTGANLIYDNDPNWDWRAPNYDMNFLGSNGLHSYPSPFWQGLAGLEDLDYQPDDGWVLMAKNFGSATQVETSPFFVLYNKYRGTVRFAAFITGALKGNFSYGRVTMSFAEGSAKTKNLSNRSIQRPISNWLATEPSELTSLIKLQEGWNYADFQMAYDPYVDLIVEPIFLFQVDGVLVNQIELDGTSISEQRSQGLTDLNRSPWDVAAAIVPGWQKARKNYTSAQKFGEDALVYSSRMLFPNHAQKWLGIAELVMPAPSIALIPTIAGVVGFAETFIGLLRQDNKPKIVRTESHLTLSGSMTATANIASYQLRVPGANHGGQPNILPVWNYPLGTFAILNAPVCEYSTSTGPYNQAYTPCLTCDPVNYADWFAWMDILNITTPVQYVLNTSYPGCLELRSIEGAWSFQAPQLLQGASPGRWNSLPTKYLNAMNQAVADGRYVVIGSADPLGTSYYQYRTQFVELAQFHNYKPEIPRTWLSGEPYYSEHHDVTPAVQIRLHLKKPGGALKDDVVLVNSYDLFWPQNTPLTFFGPFTPVAPVWKYPVAPQQEITNLVEGEVIQMNQSWDIRWTPLAGDITNIKVGWGCDPPGGSFPTCLFGPGADLYNGLENTGIVTTSTHGPEEYDELYAYVYTCNGPACHISMRKVYFSSVDLASITVAEDPALCSGQPLVPRKLLHASWSTLIPMGAADSIHVWTPSGQHLSATVPLAAATTNHTISIDIPCENGNVRYVVSSGYVIGGYNWEVRSRSGARIMNIALCEDCNDGDGEGDPPGEEEPDPIMHALTLRSENPARVGDALILELSLPAPALIELSLFDVAGKRVARMPAQSFSGGMQHVRWRPGVTRPGAYFLRASADGRILSNRRLIMIN